MADKVQLNVWLEPEMRDQLKALAQERGCSVSELVRQGVASLLPHKPSEGDVQRASILDRLAEMEAMLDREAELSEDLDRRLTKLEEMAHGGF